MDAPLIILTATSSIQKLKLTYLLIELLKYTDCKYLL